MKRDKTRRDDVNETGRDEIIDLEKSGAALAADLPRWEKRGVGVSEAPC